MIIDREKLENDIFEHLEKNPPVSLCGAITATVGYLLNKGIINEGEGND